MGKDKKKKELYRKGYNFVVYLDDERIPFKRVSGLSDEINTEAFREGGRNNIVYGLMQPRTGERVVTLERGLISDEKEFEIYKPGYRFYDEVSIFVVGDGTSYVKSYFLDGCWVKKVSINDFDADNSSLVSVTLEIGYETLEEE